MLSHARALFREPGVIVMHGNLAESSEILAELRAQRPANLAELTVAILAMVLHFFDAETARDIVTAFARTVSPGSYFVLSVRRVGPALPGVRHHRRAGDGARLARR